MIKLLSFALYLINFSLLYPNCYTNIEQKAVNNFVLVVDQSGSMSGKPINDAKAAVKSFIGNLKSNDRASIVPFNSKVSVLHDFSSNKSSLGNSTSKINAGGGTALYDAIAKAASLLIHEQGSKIIVFLSDGDDTGSKFKVSNLKSMNISENIFVYGIGLGNINKNTLSQIVQATEGDVKYTNRSSGLSSIYNEVLSSYYTKYGSKLIEKSTIIVKSIPDARPVYINGFRVGITPYKVNGYEPGEHSIWIEFNRGNWECDINAEAGYKSVIDAREDDLGYNLTVKSSPKGSAVYIDDIYVGITSTRLSKPKVTKGGYFKEGSVENTYYGELVIPNLPVGKHRLKLIAVPDIDDFGEDFEFDFEVSKKLGHRFVDVNVLKKRASFEDGQTIKGRKSNPFDSFD